MKSSKHKTHKSVWEFELEFELEFVPEKIEPEKIETDAWIWYMVLNEAVLRR